MASSLSGHESSPCPFKLILLSSPRASHRRGRRLLPVADQHVAARGRKLRTIFLEAGQNGEVALIHQLAAETLHVAGACLLLLLRAAMSQGYRNRDRQQDERQENFLHFLPFFSRSRRF